MAAPVTGRLSERIRSLCRLALVPTGLEISGPFADIGLSAHWPGDPGPLPDMTVPGFTHGVSPGVDALRRKSTRPLWDTWLEVTRMLPPAAAPSTGRQPDSRVTQIRGGPTLAHLPLCQLAWWRPL